MKLSLKQWIVNRQEMANMQNILKGENSKHGTGLWRVRKKNDNGNPFMEHFCLSFYLK